MTLLALAACGDQSSSIALLPRDAIVLVCLSGRGDKDLGTLLGRGLAEES